MVAQIQIRTLDIEVLRFQVPKLLILLHQAY